MANYTYKKGIERLRNRRLTGEKKRGIEMNRSLFISELQTPIKPENPDTVIRKQIHMRIKQLLNIGKAKTEILDILNIEFPDSNLKNFFDNYVQHHLNKIKNEKGRDDE